MGNSQFPNCKINRKWHFPSFKKAKERDFLCLTIKMQPIVAKKFKNATKIG